MSLEEQMEGLAQALENLTDAVNQNNQLVQALMEMDTAVTHTTPGAKQEKEAKPEPKEEEVAKEVPEEETAAGEPEKEAVEEPEKDEAPSGTTADDLKEAFVALTDKHGRAGMVSILKAFGASKFSGLEPAEYDQVMAAIKKKLEG